MMVRHPLQVRVNDELVLDAGTYEDLSTSQGLERLIRPPVTTLFHQLLGYLRAMPDPPKRPSGSMVGREGVAAAAVVLRWGSYPDLDGSHGRERGKRNMGKDSGSGER
jgi:hypothetical protein